jgi:hypothetical protein
VEDFVSKLAAKDARVYGKPDNIVITAKGI